MTEGRDMTAQPRLLGGRYQVGELLGYGGMAEVHRGRDLRLGRDVAIKTLRHDLARDATFQLRFQREAQNSASLNHPAIVAVYDTGEEIGAGGEHLPYIVMEFVNGRTLKEVLTAEGRLQTRRAMEIVADVCAALEFSHRHGIIHRDVKPGNIMLTQNGQIKVMDFGIARALGAGTSTMTQTSAVIGTAQYLSPEQARGEPVDARSDVYSTGCVLFELLCGHPPFVGDNPVSVAYQHVREDAKPPSASNRDVPPEVDAIVLKALAKNPLNRYQSAGEMRADIMRALAGRPVSAPPVMTEEEMAAMLPTQTMGRQAQAPSRQPARSSQRSRRKYSAGVIAVLIILGLVAAGAIGTGIYLAGKTPTVRVPKLVGLSQAEATTELGKFRLSGTPTINIASGCTGLVISQDTPVNAEVKQGSQVNFTVCAAPNPVKVPDIAAGSPKATAQQFLDLLHLKANYQEISGAGDAGSVLSTDPKGGTMVDPGSTVTVYLSKGDEATMVDVTTKTQADAVAALKEAGFTAKPNIVVNTQITDPTQDGKVLTQDPRTGVHPKNTVVTLTVGQYIDTGSPSVDPSASASAPSNGGG